MKKKIVVMLLSLSMITSMISCSKVNSRESATGEPVKEAEVTKEAAVPATEGNAAEDKKNEVITEEKEPMQTLKLTYNTAGRSSGAGWQVCTLPFGNAKIGATFDGNVAKETLVLNEKTLWIGGPSESRPNYQGGNKGTERYQYLREMQKALTDHDQTKVDRLAAELTGDSDGYGAYQLLANAEITMNGIKANQAKNYQRWLDINTATGGVSYDIDGVTYTREYFANYPSNVIAMKFTASDPKALNMTFGLAETQDGCKLEVTENELKYYGALTDNGLRYSAAFTFITEDGQLAAKDNCMDISNASSVIVFFTAATDYENVYPDYRSGIDPSETVEAAMQAAVHKGYDALYEEHEADYQALFNRVRLSVNEQYTDLPTDKLLAQYKEHVEAGNLDATDHYLEMLYFQYGRYLLISSSRTGTLPANLQGIWNNSNEPIWSCDYHINVNLQMNYWPAFVTNLSETADSFVEYVEGLRQPGRVTAANYYNVVSDEEHPENGWVAHTQSTPFGWTCPGWDFNWGWSTAAPAWLMQNLMDYYDFTQDKTYLKEKIYPIIKESVVFYLQVLVYDEEQGRYVMSPTYSPEQGPITAGNTFEQTLVDLVFANFITAAEDLGVDADLVARVKEIKPQLKPYQVSDKTGFMKEWYGEDDADFDNSKVEKGHRHASQLLGLYPGNTINYNTTDLMQAAIASLNDRGDEATGWARANKLCLWSRTGDGNRAYSIFNGLLTKCTYDNLWDTHPPFQIDGNFGGTAGMAELLLQSHMGYIQLLPALPDAWKDGSYYGLCARGGFEVALTWKDAKVTSLEVTSKTGNDCSIQIADAVVTDQSGNEVAAVYQDGILTFQTKAGNSYHIKIK